MRKESLSRKILRSQDSSEVVQDDGLSIAGQGIDALLGLDFCQRIILKSL